MDKAQVLERYTRIAPSYDRIVNRWARAVFMPLDRYRQEAVGLLKLRSGDTVLDIGCGTGLNFPILQERVGSAGKIIGLDYTPAMLDQARLRTQRAGWQNVELVQGDAGDVAALVRGPIDGVLSTACLSIVPRYEEAIAGAVAILRPGGRLVILDFARMCPAGPLGVLAAPLVRWWTKHYGFAAPEEDYGREKPWKEVLEKHLINVKFERRYLGMLFIACGEKPVGEGA